MKVLALVFLVCGILVGTNGVADAASTRCNGSYETISGGSIYLNCTNGHCSGWLNSDYFTVNDRCDSSGLRFSASGSKGSEYVSGSCNNGFFNGWLPSISITLNGTCSDGGSFNGYLSRSSVSLSGSCREDGSGSVYVSSQSARLDGTCY